MLINLARGRRYIDCGCGGPGQPISYGLVVRNGALMGFAVLAAPRVGTLDVTGILTVGAAVLVAACLYVAANHLLTLRALLDEPDL